MGWFYQPFFHSPFQLLPFLGMSSFFAYLFLMTFLLRAHVEQRRSGKPVSQRLIGALMTLPGGWAAYFAWALATGQATLTGSHRGQWLLWLTEWLGPWPAVLLMLYVSGLMLSHGLRRLWTGRA